MEISPHCDYIAMGTYDRLIVLMDYSEGTMQDYVGHCDAVQCLTFSKDGEVLYSGGYSDICQWRVCN